VTSQRYQDPTGYIDLLEAREQTLLPCAAVVLASNPVQGTEYPELGVFVAFVGPCRQVWGRRFLLNPL
jgi:hypothetical protein